MRTTEATDFDIARLRARRTNKWHKFPPDVVPAWVADMDFGVAPSITAALARLTRDQEYGYAARDGVLAAAFVRRTERRFGWHTDPADAIAIGDLVQASFSSVMAFSEPGDAILLLCRARAFHPHARAKKLPRAAECLVYSLTPSGVLAENHPKNRGLVGILRGQKCLRRGQKCLKRGFLRRSPVGEWSRGARSMPRVFSRGSRSRPAALVSDQPIPASTGIWCRQEMACSGKP